MFPCWSSHSKFKYQVCLVYAAFGTLMLATLLSDLCSLKILFPVLQIGDVQKHLVII
jgi:hypothetical protein